VVVVVILKGGFAELEKKEKRFAIEATAAGCGPDPENDLILAGSGMDGSALLCNLHAPLFFYSK
jgi:hypothetical protein